MSIPRALVVYGTSYGQTEKIARRVGEVLRSENLEVTIVDASNLPRDLRVPAFDAIVVGASVIAGGHQRSVRQFVLAHAGTLNRLPSAFFSVCASAGSRFATARQAAAKLRETFLQSMGWQPSASASIAGAINFTRYNLVLRWYMRWASKRNGGSTNTSRDHEYTDWNQVEAFARDFASSLRDGGRPVSAGAVDQEDKKTLGRTLIEPPQRFPVRY